jgi:hypothetical protein
MHEERAILHYKLKTACISSMFKRLTTNFRTLGTHATIVSKINTISAQGPLLDTIGSSFPSYASVAAKPGPLNGAAVVPDGTNERIENEDNTSTTNQSEVITTSEQNGIAQRAENTLFHEATSNSRSDAVEIATASSTLSQENGLNEPSKEVEVLSLPISSVVPVIPLKFLKEKEPSLVPTCDRIHFSSSPSPILTPTSVPGDIAQTLPTILIQEAAPALLASKPATDWRSDSTPLYSSTASKVYFPLPIGQRRAGDPAPSSSVTDWRANAKPLSAELVSRNNQIQPYLPLPIGNGRAWTPATEWRANSKSLQSEPASKNFQAQAHLHLPIGAGRTSTALTNAIPIPRTFIDFRFGDSSSNSDFFDEMGIRGDARRAAKASATRFFFCEGTTPTPIAPSGLERVKPTLKIQRELENIIQNGQVGSEAQAQDERAAFELSNGISRISITNAIAKPIPTGPKNMNMNRDRATLTFGPNRRENSSSSLAQNTKMGPSTINQHNEAETKLQQRGILTPIPTAPKAMRGEEVATRSNRVARILRGEVDPPGGSKSSTAQLGIKAKNNTTNLFGGLFPSQVQSMKTSPLERNAMTVSAPPEAKGKAKSREESRPVKMERAATLPTCEGLGEAVATRKKHSFGENSIMAPTPMAGWYVNEAVNHFPDNVDQLTVPRAMRADEGDEKRSDAATVVQDYFLVVAKRELATAGPDATKVNRPLIPGTNQTYALVACELIGLPLSSHHGPRPHCIPQPWAVPKCQPSDKKTHPRPRGGAFNGGRFVLEKEWLLDEEENRADFIALPFQLRGNKDRAGESRKVWNAPIMGLKGMLYFLFLFIPYWSDW